MLQSSTDSTVTNICVCKHFTHILQFLGCSFQQVPIVYRPLWSPTDNIKPFRIFTCSCLIGNQLSNIILCLLFHMQKAFAIILVLVRYQRRFEKPRQLHPHCRPILYRYCNSLCLSKSANCRSQFLLDRLGRCLKLFISTESTSCHEFASQFGLQFFYTQKIPNTIAKNTVAYAIVYLNEAPTDGVVVPEPQGCVMRLVF